MALAFLTIGLVMVVTALRGTAGDLYALLIGDFEAGFVYWLIAIGFVGLIGQVPALKQFSTWFLVLILLVLVLKNRQAIPNFEEAFNITPAG